MDMGIVDTNFVPDKGFMWYIINRSPEILIPILKQHVSFE